MSLVAAVAAHLAGERIPFALIGAAALAAHGVSRSTVDLDLLTTEARVLQQTFWITIPATVDVRRGDADDPLAGVVRITGGGEREVDVVVGRSAWQAEIIARAQMIPFDDVSLPVVAAADLVLLKLYAGGSTDAWDIEQLLAAGGRDALIKSVDAAVEPLPSRAHELWQRLRQGGS